MLIVLQIPVADLRPFLETPSVVGPYWPLPPDPQRRGFLRGVGGLCKLNDAGASPIKDWPTDAWYVNARKAIRLPPSTFPQASEVKKQPARVLRRISSDGGAVWQVQFGIEVHSSVVGPPDLQVIRPLVEEFLALPLRLLQPVGRMWGQPLPLLNQRLKLADMLTGITTPRSSTAPEKCMLTGMPLVYVETDASDEGGHIGSRISIPMHPGTWKHKAGDCAFIWVETSGVPRAQLNNVRLNLLHLHSELEVVKLVLRSATKMGAVRPALEKFLQHEYELLTKPRRFGIDQAELSSAFATYEDFSASERAAVVALLEKMPQSLDRTTALIEKMRGGGNSITIIQEVEHMSTITVGTNTGQIIADSSFTNSTNIIQQTATGELKTALEQLLSMSKQLAQKLPEEQREEVCKRTETLAREATSTKPDKSILSISAAGLIEAAKTVAEMAKPIATSVAAVLAILAI